MSSRTASPRTPRSASVSAGISWARRVSRNSRTLVWPLLLLGAGGGSNSAQIASRSRWASRAPLAAAPGWRARSRAAPVGAVPQRPEHLLGGARRRRAPARAWASRPASRGARRAGSPSRPVERRRARARRGGPARGRAPSRSRAAQRAGQGADVGRVEAAERRGEQRLGPVGADVVVVGAGRRRRRRRPRASAPSSGSTAGSRTSGRLVAGHLDRDAGGGERAAQAGDRRRGPSGPAPPSRTSRCRPRGGRAAAGRRRARSRRGRCRR